MPNPAAETIGDVVRYLHSEALSGVDPVWPPDAFAIAATILKRSGAYREVANAWPPPGYADTNDWHEKINHVAHDWRNSCDTTATTLPGAVKAWWEAVIRNQTVPLAAIIDNRGLFIALVGIVAAADFACRGFGFRDAARTATPKEDRANTNLAVSKSLCEAVHASRCAVLPKAHNPFTGMTLRSLTHHLALWDKPEVSASWENIRLDIPQREMNLLLVPWPLVVDPNAFREAADCHQLRLPNRVGLFEYDIPFVDADIPRLSAIVERTTADIGPVHGIVFPELTMTPRNFAEVREQIQQRLRIPLMISGIGCSNTDRLGTNNVAISVHSELEQPYLQGKHHRWRLDARQAEGYGITTLAPKPQNGAWWESTHIENRSCIFFNANDWLTFCVLICEDLARQDPVSELVRSVGPSLLVALLLDGPQVRGRWPDRYATVFAEDPRSSVLTLTCAGLVDLSNSRWGGEKQRSIGLWRDADSSASTPIILEDGREAVVLRLESKMAREWTADGRHDDEETGYLVRKDTIQVSGP